MATATRPRAVDAANPATGAIGAAVVVSADRLVRTGVRRTLDRSGFTIAAEASSLAPVLSTARKPGVAIAVVDIEGDIVCDDALRTLATDTGVIVLSDSAENSAAALMLGVVVCLSRSASFQELSFAAESARRRRPLIGGPAVVELMALAQSGRVNQRVRSMMGERLSPREIDVLRGLAQGWGNGVIGASLHISPKTVKNHVANILSKLEIENRIQAAVMAVQGGLVTGDMVSNVEAARAALTAPHSRPSIR